MEIGIFRNVLSGSMMLGWREIEGGTFDNDLALLFISVRTYHDGPKFTKGLKINLNI